MMLYHSGPHVPPDKEISLDEFMFIDGPALDQRVNIRMGDSEYVVAIDVDGLARDGCRAILKNNTLILKGERWHERRYEAFQRKVRLHKNASTSSIKAQYHNGLLTIRISNGK